VEWKARNDEQIEGSWTVDGYPFTTRYTLDSDGMISSVVFDRWGDPERSGSFGVHPFGGEFFRYQITDVTPSGLERPR
jgi:hypothetical protein